MLIFIAEHLDHIEKPMENILNSYIVLAISVLSIARLSVISSFFYMP